jgi:hypothetical protein
MPSLTTDSTQQEPQRRNPNARTGDHLQDPLRDPLQSVTTGTQTRNQDPNGPRRQGMRDVRGMTETGNQQRGDQTGGFVEQHHLLTKLPGDSGQQQQQPDPNGFESQRGDTQTNNTTGAPEQDRTGGFTESRIVRAKMADKPAAERVAEQGLLVHGIANQLVQEHGTEDSGDSGSSGSDDAVTSLMQAPDTEQDAANDKIAKIAPMLGTPPSGAPGKLEDQSFQDIKGNESELFVELQSSLGAGDQNEPTAPTQTEQKQQQLADVTASLPDAPVQDDKFGDTAHDSHSDLGQQNSQQLKTSPSKLQARSMSSLKLLDETVGRGQKGTNVQDVGSLAMGATETEAPGVTGTLGVMSGLGGLALTGLGAKGVYDGAQKWAGSDDKATTQHGKEQLADNAVNVGRGGLMSTSGGMQIATAVGQTVESAPGLGLASGVVGTAVFGTKAIKGQARKNKLAKVQTGDESGDQHQQLDQANEYAQEKMSSKATRNAVATGGRSLAWARGPLGSWRPQGSWPPAWPPPSAGRSSPRPCSRAWAWGTCATSAGASARTKSARPASCVPSTPRPSCTCSIAGTPRSRRRPSRSPAPWASAKTR